MTCSNCGLVLADPRAPRLLEIGRSMVSLEAERQGLIRTIRSEHRLAPEPSPPKQPWSATDRPEVASVATLAALLEPAAESIAVTITVGGEPAGELVVEPRAEAGAVAPPPEPPMTRAAASAPSQPPRRRLSVPVLLLIVGVSLVGIAAIFFLVLAWNIADIGMRALIIGGVTLATMAAAALLRRWSLTATAEGIGCLGVILLALDGWAVRANDLFGAGGMDPVVYAGVAALALAAVCRAWAVFSRLRGPDLAATLALPTGVGLLVAGLVPLDTAGAFAAGFVGTAIGGLAFALPAPWSAARTRTDSVPEHTALAVLGMAGLVGAGAMLALGLESIPVQLMLAVSVIVLGIAYVLLLRTRPDAEPLPASRALEAAAGAVSAAATATLGWQVAAQSALPVYAELVAPVIAVTVAVGLDRWARRGAAFVAARISGAIFGALSLIVLLTASALRAQQALGVDWGMWRTPVFTAPIASDTTAAMLGALAAIIVSTLLFFAPALARPVLRDVRPIVGAILVLVGVMGTGIPILIVATAVALAAIALARLALPARSLAPMGWGVVAGLAALTAFIAGLAAPWLWGIGVVVAIAVPITARALIRPKAEGAVLLALAPVAVAAVAAFIAPAAIGAAFDVEVDTRAAFKLLQWVAAGALVCAVALRLDSPSRAALAISSYGLLGISLLAFLSEPAGAGTASASIGEPLLAIVRAAALLVLLVVVALVRTRIDPLTSLGAAVLLAPAAACAVVGVLETLRVTDEGPTALFVAGAAVAVVWLGALVPRRMYGVAEGAAASTDAAPSAEPATSQAGPAPYATLARRCADVGALATLVAAGSVVPSDVDWAMLLTIAVGLAGASITRGWAAPATSRAVGVPETRAVGLPLTRAPRRLLAWPAFAAATLALWVWLDGAGSYEIEAFAVPPAVGLLVFAVVLVWLRRGVEATIAVAASFTLGLVLPALASVAVGSDSPVRGTAVATVAAALTALVAWTPARRVRVPAIAGAVVAIVGLGIVAVDRALTTPAGTGWLLLLVGAAYAAALGFLRPFAQQASFASISAGTVSFVPERWFAVLAPALALATSALAVIPSLDEGVVVAVAIAVQGALHLAASALHRDPLGAATRWTALAGAVVAAGGAFVLGDVDAVELVSLPIAGMLLGGAALAIWRRARAGEPWPGRELFAWLAGLAIAVAPSVVAEPNDPRTWLVIAGTLLAAIGCLVAPIADSTGLKTPSAIVLTTGALAMGVRALFAGNVESREFAAIAAGVGALLVAATMVWMSESDAPPIASTALAGAGAALLVGVVTVQSEGELVQASLTAVIAGTIGVGGAFLLRWPRWAGLGGVLAVGGLIAALVAIALRFAQVATLAGTGVEPDLWAVAGVGILVAIGVMALRSTTSSGVATAVGVTFSTALVLFAAAELILLGTGDGDQMRTVLTMTALVIVGILGWILRSRVGAALAPTAAVAAGLFGLVALVVFAVRPIELVTVPAALGMLFVGARELRRRSALRTWPALGPGLALLLIPSLAYDFGTTSLWRVVALGVVAIALIVVGAVWRLQAPLILGSVVVLVHAVSQLWPWISDVYAIVPWWLWLGIGGALLIYIAARYERRMRALRAAFTAVTSLR
ncbi:SCO7613 C-terminal domain-containing membrane protein [Microbacterium pumilum]